jgi:hypothetical protein
VQEDADKEEAEDVENFLRCMALCHSAIPDSKEQREREEAANDAKADGDKNVGKNADKDEAALRAKNGDKGKDKNEAEDETRKQEKEKEKSEKKLKKKRKMKKKRSKRDREEDEHDARDRDEDEDDEEDEKEEDEDAIDYKASSPDEEALCRAARDNGFVFVKRAPQALTVEENGNSAPPSRAPPLTLPYHRVRACAVVRVASCVWCVCVCYRVRVASYR